MKGLKTILFDLDGTLIDSEKVVWELVAETCKHFDISMPDTIGSLSLISIVRKAAPNLPSERQMEIVAYAAHRSGNSISRIQPFAGTADVLLTLSKNYTLGIVTSRTRDSTLALLQNNKMQDFFKSIVAGDDVVNGKPSPDGILKAMDVLGVTSDETLYVGDAEPDIEAAKAAGTRSVLIGRTNYMFGQDYYILEISELPALLGVNS